jgi:hypothetical protein
VPFQSQKQRAWAHANPEALGGEAKVSEWESETPSKLPRYKHGATTSPKLKKKFSHASKKK